MKLTSFRFYRIRSSHIANHSPNSLTSIIIHMQNEKECYDGNNDHEDWIETRDEPSLGWSCPFRPRALVSPVGSPGGTSPPVGGSSAGVPPSVSPADRCSTPTPVESAAASLSKKIASNDKDSHNRFMGFAQLVSQIHTTFIQHLHN